MSHISVSSPFLVSFTHADIAVDNTVPTEVLATAPTGTRRILTVVQNKHSTATIQVILNSTGSTGIAVLAGSNLTLDNYNGPVRCISTVDDSIVHIAYATA
jgi:hypothetical protein